MDQRVRVPQVVEEFVAQPLARVCPRDEPGYVEEFDGYAAPATVAGAVVGPAAVA